MQKYRTISGSKSNQDKVTRKETTNKLSTDDRYNQRQRKMSDDKLEEAITFT